MEEGRALNGQRAAAHRRGQPARDPGQFGAVRKLPSGRWQARFVGPDGVAYTAKTEAGRARTFVTKADASLYLTHQRAAISKGTWTPPGPCTDPAAMTIGQYAAAWLETRTLAARTRDLYASLLRRRILPTFDEVPITAATPVMIREWYASQDKLTARAHAYALLKSILTTAVADGLLQANPCAVRGGSSVRREKEPVTAELGELPRSGRLCPSTTAPRSISLCGLRCASARCAASSARRSTSNRAWCGYAGPPVAPPTGQR